MTLLPGNIASVCHSTDDPINTTERPATHTPLTPVNSPVSPARFSIFLASQSGYGVRIFEARLRREPLRERCLEDVAHGGLALPNVLPLQQRTEQGGERQYRMELY